MEDKYISAKWLREKFRKLADEKTAIANEKQDKYYRGKAHAYAIVEDSVDIAPAADVLPVKHGFWKSIMMSEATGWDLSLTGGYDAVCEYVCSVCGKPNIVDEFGYSYLPNFCPNCGARMDGKE